MPRESHILTFLWWKTQHVPYPHAVSEPLSLRQTDGAKTHRFLPMLLDS